MYKKICATAQLHTWNITKQIRSDLAYLSSHSLELNKSASVTRCKAIVHPIFFNIVFTYVYYISNLICVWLK